MNPPVEVSCEFGDFRFLVIQEGRVPFIKEPVVLGGPHRDVVEHDAEGSGLFSDACARVGHAEHGEGALPEVALGRFVPEGEHGTDLWGSG